MLFFRRKLTLIYQFSAGDLITISRIPRSPPAEFHQPVPVVVKGGQKLLETEVAGVDSFTAGEETKTENRPQNPSKYVICTVAIYHQKPYIVRT